MDWKTDRASADSYALDPELGVILAVTETMDGWWSWHASYEGTDWSPDVRWFASRSEAESSAAEWAATLAEQHIGFLCRQPHAPQLALA